MSLQTGDIDTAFMGVFSDWIDKTSSAAASAVARILRDSKEYLNPEYHTAITNFHSLYFSDAKMNEHNLAVNREVDDLFDKISEKMADSDDTDVVIDFESSVLEGEEAKTMRLSLSGVQKQLETIIQFEEGIRDRLVPILSNFQFEEFIRQRMEQLSSVWLLVMGEVQESENNLEIMRESLGQMLVGDIERDAFTEVLMKSMDSDQSEDPIMAFLIDMLGYTEHIVLSCSSESERAMSSLSGIVQFLLEDSDRIGKMDEQTNAAVLNLQNVVSGMGAQDSENSIKEVIGSLKTVMSENKGVDEIVSPIIEALQFQDIFRQHLENLHKSLQLWVEMRIDASEKGEDSHLTFFGKCLLKATTMQDEREIIRRHISGLGEEKKAEDMVFF